MAFINEMKNKYRTSSMLMRLIYINIAVFVVLRVIGLVGFLFNTSILASLKWIEVSSNPWEVLVHPWTVLTYAFAHYEIFHILFNMLWLYWLGRIFMEYFNAKQLVALYIYGALGGAAIYLAAYNVIPAFVGVQGYMLGASASVMAIVVAIAVYAPNYKIGLLFIGQISLKWVALVIVLIDIFSIDAGSASNAGGHIAHLGGAMTGLLFAMLMNRGHDITRPLNASIDWVVSLFARRKRPGVGGPVGGTAFRQKANKENAADASFTQKDPAEEELDRILAKLKRSGYTALTDEERALLFSYSKKDKK